MWKAIAASFLLIGSATSSKAQVPAYVIGRDSQSNYWLYTANLATGEASRIVRLSSTTDYGATWKSDTAELWTRLNTPHALAKVDLSTTNGLKVLVQ